LVVRMMEWVEMGWAETDSGFNAAVNL